MSSANLPAKTKFAARPYDLLVYSEIIPVLPNFSTADLRLIGSHEARQEALSTVLRAVDELLAERGASRQEPVDEFGESRTEMPTPEVDPWVSPEPLLVGEPLPGDPTPRRRNIKTPVAIAAGLAIIALAALVWPGVLSSRSTHVAATKTPTSLGPSKDAQTVQPSPPASTPQPASAPAPTVTTPDDAVPDVTVEPLPTSPPTTKVACPSGNVTAAVSQVQAQQSPDDRSSWNMTITGTLRNGTNTSVDAPAIDVTITGSNGDEPAYGDADSSQLAPGQTTTWNATSYVSSTTRPTATATPDRWVWLDSHYADCPSGSSPPASAR